ncbi:Secretion protein HlyD precursor [Methylomonas albis]|uniref:Efflux RND transporter periplasmic adaptor subunit n=1 Tax=Methylomonas albis TaxID=1854563 RepID=A0ABR9D5W5_9GAMM|nr:efflux RND transporter periplasmic adaptor subunit [Methylomonas albis]MBD9358514.1 efflux RND transporter periplasmic adaptor subunit [Methylomonas albis]CAD6881928.1 Secretion protein HlyD precursor [Methylomonas albis]
MKFHQTISLPTWLAGITLAGLSIAIPVLTSAPAPAAVAAKSKPVLAVETLVPTRQDWPVAIKVNGAVAAWQEAKIGAEIGSLRIKQVLVDVGDRVKRGQDLAVLADDTVLAELHKQQASVDKSRANLAKAQADAARAREIQDSGALSSQKIDEYVIAEQTARADLALAQAELENQRIRLSQTHIVASDDGVISARGAGLGDVVAAGTELFRLVRQGRVEWRAEVNAQQLAQIRVGQAVELSLPDGGGVIGNVRMTAPTVDDTTRNALVYVDIPNAGAKPGMYLQGSIVVGAQSALVVPQTALVLRDGRDYLFEIAELSGSAEQTAKPVIQRSVVTGRRVGDWVEIRDGIGGDARLVANGGAFLKDGDIVSVTPNN